MKKNYKVFLLLFVIALLASSAQTIGQEMLKEKLQGVWVQVKIEYQENDTTMFEDVFQKFQGYEDGYKFNDDKIESMNNPFYSRLIYEDIRETLQYHNYFENREYITDYKIDKDRLLIKRIKVGDWIKIKVISLKNDTLILGRDKYTETFVRKNYIYKKNVRINQIVFRNEIGEIIMPVYEIQINNDRTVYLKGIENTKYLGNYKSKLSKKQYKRLINSLLMVDLENLMPCYTIKVTDQSTYYLKIVYNDSNIINVEDYGQSGPVELRWFYPKITELINILDFEKID